MKNSTILLVLTFCVLFTAIECCTDSEVRCADDSGCISSQRLCDSSIDCFDGSDENERFCQSYQYVTSDYSYSNCMSNGELWCSIGRCYMFPEICSSCRNRLTGNQLTSCRMITSDGMLNFESSPKMDIDIHNVTFENILTEFNTNFNRSSFCSLSPNECPPLYSKVKDQCVAFFSIAQVTWFDAQNFCKSINGHLAIIDDAMKFFNILKHISTEELKADFWLGGRTYWKEESNITSWRWTNDVQMFAGAPFWAISRNHTGPCPSGYRNLECSRAPIHPLDSSEGRCVAITYKNNFYFTDHSCFQSKSPLCIYDSKQDSNSKSLDKDEYTDYVNENEGSGSV